MDGIVLNGVTKRFGGTTVLAGVDLRVAGGEIVGLCGPNGSGKTTLLRVAATLLTPDSGSGMVAGADLLMAPHEARAKLGVALVNERSFYWRLNGLANLVFFARVGGIPAPTARSKAAHLIEAIGLKAVAQRPVRTWSTGQRQRLVIARALLGDPPVLLLDEPLRGLDDEGIELVAELFEKRRREGASVLMAAPTPSDLKAVQQGTVWLRDGRLQASALVAT